MNIVEINARDLSDAWFQCIYKILEEGSTFTIDRGSYAGQKRLEFDHITIRIRHPGTQPLLPQIEPHYGIPNPAEDAHLYGGEGYDRSYVEYLMSGRKEPGEAYTYGERLAKDSIPKEGWFSWYDKDAIGSPPFEMPKWDELEVIPNPDMSELFIPEKEVWNDPKILVREKDSGQLFLNQIELLIWTYKTKGYRNNQMVLQVAQPTDMLLDDPPCLRHIDTRIQRCLDSEMKKLEELINKYDIGVFPKDEHRSPEVYKEILRKTDTATTLTKEELEVEIKSCETFKLHFFPYFRSWDLWGGFPSNLGAIQILKEFVAAEIGVEDGEIIASSKGLHVYDYVFDMAKLLRMKEDMELKDGDAQT